MTLRGGDALDRDQPAPPFDVLVDAISDDYLEAHPWGSGWLDAASWRHYLPFMMEYALRHIDRAQRRHRRAAHVVPPARPRPAAPGLADQAAGDGGAALPRRAGLRRGRRPAATWRRWCCRSGGRRGRSRRIWTTERGRRRRRRLRPLRTGDLPRIEGQARVRRAQGAVEARSAAASSLQSAAQRLVQRHQVGRRRHVALQRLLLRLVHACAARPAPRSSRRSRLRSASASAASLRRASASARASAAAWRCSSA